jgi:L-fuculose-phosphate aldolase
MKLTEGIMVAGSKVPMAGYQRPGTKELADTVTYVLGRGSAVIMANHGLVCVGASLEQALEVSLAVESSARTEIYAALLGGKPIGVSRSEASLLREHYLENYKPHPV